MIEKIKKELAAYADKERARVLSHFFKTGKGEYGEGDVFLGIKACELKKTAKKYFKKISLNDLQSLLKSKIHEYRSVALEILKKKYEKIDDDKRKQDFIKFYLKNTKYINNWDLVDMSAHHILGNWLIDHPNEKKVIYDLAKSNDLWERRISIISTFAFIKKGQFDDTLKIAMIVLADKHDLIHKAVGWMLREVGKKDQAKEEEFLANYSNIMPRTMLRYAIEKFPERKRKFYLKTK